VILAGGVVRGAVVATAASRLLRAAPPGGAARWQRTNHRGTPVTLLAGPALAVALATTSPAAALAGLTACAVGAYDDLAGSRAAQAGAKGFRGHLGALRRGQVTGGTVKLAGIAASGLAAAALLPGRRRPLDVLLGGGVVAASANLANLLDLRPGRALKVGLLAAAALGQPVTAGAAAALLPADLGERTMLGDAGANALGAVLGVALARRLPGRRSTAAALATLTALTAASEVVSYSRVIDATPVLRRLDQLGRRP
jgi:UDP-GlcNAc:undecaprenyl-phosphate/decaprenyl-phosphate GlcNAc-1-phosphate transferase